jgi:hypothetical protein
MRSLQRNTQKNPARQRAGAIRQERFFVRSTGTVVRKGVVCPMLVVDVPLMKRKARPSFKDDREKRNFKKHWDADKTGG